MVGACQLGLYRLQSGRGWVEEGWGEREEGQEKDVELNVSFLSLRADMPSVCFGARWSCTALERASIVV